MAQIYDALSTDIPQMTSKSVEIVPPFHRQGNGIPSAAIRPLGHAASAATFLALSWQSQRMVAARDHGAHRAGD